jgi:ABC-type nitrate/sulfonate/bicarbonate transport system substrate-binding protein
MEYWNTGVLGLKRITSLLHQSRTPSFVALEKLMFACCRSLLSRLFVSILVISVMSFTISPGIRAQEQIVVGYDGHAGFQGPIWATKDLGLFDKYGLSGELVLIPGSARGMAALISGSVPFVQGSATAPLSTYLRGGDVVVVAAALNKFPFSVVARKEMRNPSDLIGKKIGILNFGGSNDLAVSMAFKEWNIPRNAATILVSGGAPERLAACGPRRHQ